MPSRSRLAVIAAAALLAVASGPPVAAPVPKVEFMGSLAFSIDDPRFGGFSSLELDTDGRSFVSISDRGAVMTGRLKRDGLTEVVGAEAALSFLTDTQRRPLAGRLADPEGLAIAPDGRAFVSFEQDHRVWRYDTLGATADALPVAPAFRDLRRNSGLEALAIDARGHLYTLPESSGAADDPHPVWRFDGQSWTQAFSLPRDGAFLPVGADFGPDGALYLLEREFRGLRGLFGFRTRISRVGIGPGGTISQEVLLETGVHRHDNLEAIAVWSDHTGAIRLTLMSDDNFSPLQRTELVEYRVID